MEQYLLNCWALFLCSMLECLSRKIFQSDEDCKNRLKKLPESNLTSFLPIKVSGLTEKYFAKTVNNWYHDKDRRINQKPWKNYRKRKASKPPRKEFQLPYLFETSSESEEEEEEEDVMILENVIFWLVRWKLFII